MRERAALIAFSHSAMSPPPNQTFCSEGALAMRLMWLGTDIRSCVLYCKAGKGWLRSGEISPAVAQNQGLELGDLNRNHTLDDLLIGQLMFRSPSILA